MHFFVIVILLGSETVLLHSCACVILFAQRMTKYTVHFTSAAVVVVVSVDRRDCVGQSVPQATHALRMETCNVKRHAHKRCDKSVAVVRFCVCAHAPQIVRNYIDFN